MQEKGYITQLSPNRKDMSVRINSMRALLDVAINWSSKADEDDNIVIEGIQQNVYPMKKSKIIAPEKVDKLEPEWVPQEFTLLLTSLKIKATSLGKRIKALRL